MLDRRRAVIGLGRRVKLQLVRELIRCDRARHDLATPCHRITVHAVVLRRSARVIVGIVLECRLDTAVGNILIQNSPVLAAYVLIRIRPVDLVCRRLVKGELLRIADKSTELDLVLIGMRRENTAPRITDNRPRAVIDLVNILRGHRQRLFVNIRRTSRHRMRGIVPGERVVGKRIRITREGQLVVHRAPIGCSR